MSKVCTTVRGWLPHVFLNVPPVAHNKQTCGGSESRTPPPPPPAISALPAFNLMHILASGENVFTDPEDRGGDHSLAEQAAPGQTPALCAYPLSCTPKVKL